jgi:chromosome partitioning protein
VKTVAIISQKGGVGKTTLALNLSYSAGFRGWRTLLVDTDPQGAVGLSLRGADRHPEGLAEVVSGRASLRDALIPTRLHNFQILPLGQVPPVHARRWSHEMEDGAVFQRLFERLSGSYDLVFLDTPPGLSGAACGVLRSARHVLGPLQAEPLALRSVPQLLEVIEALQQAGQEISLTGLILTMLQTRHASSLAVARDSWAHFPPQLVFETTVPRDPIFLRASELGVPVGLLRRRPPAVAAVFHQLVAELEPRLGLGEEEEDDGSMSLLT